MTKDEIEREQREMEEQRKRLAQVSRWRPPRLNPGSTGEKRFPATKVRESRGGATLYHLRDGSRAYPLWLGPIDNHDHIGGELIAWDPRVIKKIELGLSQGREARDEAKRLG